MTCTPDLSKICQAIQTVKVQISPNFRSFIQTRTKILAQKKKILLHLQSIKNRSLGRVASPEDSGKTAHGKTSSSFKTIVTNWVSWPSG